ncbi:MAG TPA: tripartite tricarboxylate transporter substrate binding protein [Burkholderiales bacterium]|jgi:tripartite-type tricarboxylate transporter receptor subunit TctC
MRRWFARGIGNLLAVALLGWALGATGQDWPKRPVTFVVVNAPGAITDILARLIGQKLAEAIGQVVVVENRPGAGGNIAAQRVHRASTDGYTLLLTSAAYAVNPSLYANAGYDPTRDFIPVILAASVANIVCVHPSVPASNLRELIALARKERLAYASPGVGTTPHLSMERIKSAAMVDITHVPYQPAAAVTAALTGQTQVLSLSVSLTLPHLNSGKLRPIAVTSAQRSPALPGVPTVNEQGLGGFDDLNWFGFFAPSGVPSEVVTRLNAEIYRVLDLPEVTEKLQHLGLDPRHDTPSEFSAFVNAELAKWAEAVGSSGAKAD